MEEERREAFDVVEGEGEEDGGGEEEDEEERKGPASGAGCSSVGRSGEG